MAFLYRRSAGVEMAPLEREGILFDPESNKFCLLNQTAAFVWSRLGDGTTADELANQVCSGFDGVSQGQALEDTRQVLEELVTLGLVVTDPA
jgi:hypothetical protein